MALQPCRECGKEISTEAVSCPYCGIQHPAGETGRCHGCGETVTVADNYCPLCGVEDPLVPFTEARKRRSARSGASPHSAAEKRQASVEALKAKGDAMSAVGCILTLLVTVPILIIIIFLALVG